MKDRPFDLPKDQPIPVRACQLGDRLHLRGLTETPLAKDPLLYKIHPNGLAVLFRYGVVVTFNVQETDHALYLASLAPLVIDPILTSETEESVIFLTKTSTEEGVTQEGIGLHDLSLPRLQIVAVVLARSVALARYEVTTAGAFDTVEPLLSTMQQTWERRQQSQDLLKLITSALRVQHRMAGRMEIQDKPDILWDHPELERVYLRLESEYELRERNAVLERKLALISNTMETAINLLHNQRSRRLEWYIVILIVIEVVLSFYQIGWGR